MNICKSVLKLFAILIGIISVLVAFYLVNMGIFAVLEMVGIVGIPSKAIVAVSWIVAFFVWVGLSNRKHDEMETERWRRLAELEEASPNEQATNS